MHPVTSLKTIVEYPVSLSLFGGKLVRQLLIRSAPLCDSKTGIHEMNRSDVYAAALCAAEKVVVRVLACKPFHDNYRGDEWLSAGVTQSITVSVDCDDVGYDLPVIEDHY